MSQKLLGIGKKTFWIGLIGICVVALTVSFNWASSRSQLKKDAGALHNTALEVQAAAFMMLMDKKEPVQDGYLKTPFSPVYSDWLLKLDKLIKTSGMTVDTGYNDNTLGYALSASNFVLTGSNEAVILDLNEASAASSRRLNERLESIPLFPW